MSGRPSEALAKAIRLLGKMNALQAAKKAGISPSTIYRAAEYKAWRDANKKGGA